MKWCLGNFSAYSFYGAAWTVEQLVTAAGVAGYAGVGLADAGGVWGGVGLSQACDRAGLRMVLGARVKLRDFAPEWLQITVRDRRGYAALCELLSGTQDGEAEWEDVERLQAKAAGHLWLSCPVRAGRGGNGRIGPFARWRSGWERLAEVDRDNLWLELGWVNAEERLLQRRVFGEWRRHGWERWVLMSGARHAGGEAGPRRLEVLQSIGTLTRIGQRHPEKLPAGDYGLLSAAAQRRRFAKAPEVLRGTEAFAEGCSFDFRYGRLFLPNPLVRKGAGEAEQVASRGRQNRLLAQRCLRGVARRYGPSYPWRDKPGRAALRERLRRELGIVAETGYAGYFLVFGEVVDECARRGIPVLARGSAAGSLICYALGVANVCPFRFGLRFERFLNRERMRHSKLPDIDLDLPYDRREEILHWLYERYGLDKVAMIGGFAHFKARAAVAEVAKAMGLPADEAHAFSKRLPRGSLRRYLDRRDDFVEASGNWNDDRFREAVERALDLDGLPRHPMMHPCGMVIADRSLAEFTPTLPSAGGFSMTQLSMDPIEDLGLLKMDLLGQAGLSVLRDCRENLREEAERLLEHSGADPRDPLAGVDYGDERIYRMVREGGARGVFHIESPAMTGLLRLCRCADIDCLVATVSVIRPGAANEDKKTRFALRYLGREEPEYAHSVLEEVLRDSYGLLIYEEHILLVAHRFAGMDYGTADLLRRLLVKKGDEEALAELESVFRASAQKAGRGEEEIATVWHELREFSGFMFNKAHGAAYAVEAFHGCWLKYHWPVHFLAAVLNNRRGFYAPLVYVMEILRHGGDFRLPDVQAPAADGYLVREGTVQVPLWQIKGLSVRFRERWARERARGLFHDWRDLRRRCRLGRADAELLARTGALRSFFDNRHEAIWEAGRLAPKGGAHGEEDLFAAVEEGQRHARFTPMEARDRARAEAELLGFPVSLPPCAFWMEKLERRGTVPVAEVEHYLGREVEIAGLQVCHRLHRGRNGKLMKFVSFADETGMAETVLFSEPYREFGWALAQQEAARVRVLVEPDATESGISLTVTAVG